VLRCGWWSCLSLFFFVSYADTEQVIFDSILRGHIDFSSDPWPSISSSAKDLVKQMVRADPKERISAVEVLSKFHWRSKFFFEIKVV
jgi:serine/threonine protein kinase